MSTTKDWLGQFHSLEGLKDKYLLSYSKILLPQVYRV